MIFDYRTAACRARIPDAELDRLVNQIRSEFATNEMMVELHVLRAVVAIERGDITLEEALRHDPPDRSEGS